MISDVFSKELFDGENVVWSGRPRQGIILAGRDAIMIPASLMWGAFAMFWEMHAVNVKNTPIFFRLWGVPFILLGIFFVFGRFILDAYVRSVTYYALTNWRILIMRMGPFSSLTALSIDRLLDLQVTENSSGRGTIYFGPQSQIFGRYGFSGWIPSLDAPPKFLAVEDAQTIFGRIQRAIRQAS